MKHHELVSLLREWLAQLKISVDSETKLDLCIEHLEWLQRTNRQLNLTAITEPTEAARLHTLDSLAALPEVLAAPPGTLLDMGTGGGFPGLPLGVTADRSTSLVESVQKKANALRDFVIQTGIDAEVSSERLEDFARLRPKSYSVATARALAPLASLVELASPLLTQGGRLVCLKGAPSEEEMLAGDAAAGRVGLTRASSRQISLPVRGERRTIIVFEKTSQPSIELPRRVGLAQKRPLR